MKRKSREFRPTALDGTHQLEDRVVLSQVGAVQVSAYPQYHGISQSEINRGLRDINRAFTQFSNAYSRAFNASVRTWDGTARLSNGFIDNQVDLLNRRLLDVVSRFPQGVNDIGLDVTDITDSLRDTLNSQESVGRGSDRASIAYAARSAHDAILDAKAQVIGVFNDYIVNDLDNGGIPPVVGNPPGGQTPPVIGNPPVDQPLWISQAQINRGLRDINRAFNQFSSTYSRAFNASRRTWDGTARLTNEFNFNQVSLLNQRLLDVVARFPQGINDIGQDVTDISGSLLDTLDSLDSVNRASDPTSVAFAARSAHDAILDARTQVLSVFSNYINNDLDNGGLAPIE